jgi:small subunit ribosomal protein S4
METKTAPKWLEVDKANASAKAIALLSREDVDFPFEEHLIVEFYSK